MELGVQASSVSPHLLPSVAQARALTPTASRPAKLPPIASSTSSASDREREREHPMAALMQSACAELKDSMGHLQNEAQSAESRVQTAIESMWKRMMELLNQQAREYEQKLKSERTELAETQELLHRSREQEASLVHQNARMSMELAAGEKRESQLEGEMTRLQGDVSSLQGSLTSKEERISKLQEDGRRQQARDQTELEGVQKELSDKSKVLRDYQDKLSRMTEKVQKLTKGLASEKTAAEHQQKTSSDKVSQQTSENRKLVLEISKLKAQLSSSSTQSTAAREEVRRLELELHSLQRRGQEVEEGLRQKHHSSIQKMKDRISSLENEIQRLKELYVREIEKLKEQLQHAQAMGSDDFMDARIKFLRYQNQQEKVMLMKDTNK